MQQERKVGLGGGILLFLMGTFIGGNIQMLDGVLAGNSTAPYRIEQLHCPSQHQEDTSDFIIASMGVPGALAQVTRLGGLRRDRPADSELAAPPATPYFLQDLAVATNAPGEGNGVLRNDAEWRRITPEESFGISATNVDSVFDVQAGAEDTVIARFGQDNGGEFQSLVEIRTAKTLMTSGNELGRGALRLIDTVANRTMELGYYEYGAGLFTDNLFEFFTTGVSVRPGNSGSTFLAVRDFRDQRDLRLRHDGTRGVIETTGTSGAPAGGIQMGGNGPNTFRTSFGEVMLMTNEGNIGIRTATEFGTGSGVIGIAEAKAIPTGNPSRGGILYVEGGALKYRGPMGTVTTIARP
jgi:hypothetical protein